MQTTETTAISVQGLSKRYFITKENNSHLTEYLPQFTGFEENSFWALRDINFELKQGEVLGLIGKNGAGKSTLLKILSGITKPTFGKAYTHGKTGSMLEVGTGFSPDLTGRENVYMSGSLIGMNRSTIAKNMDNIIKYSGVGRFIDMQVKHYSSGMYVRLAFAILAILETEILLLDEILSVGDADFRLRSSETLMQLAKSGRTVVVASHNPQEVQALCTRVIWIDNATIKYDGPAHEAIENYLVETYGKSDTRKKELEQETTAKKTEEINTNNKSFIKWGTPHLSQGYAKAGLMEVSAKALGKALGDDIYMEDEVEVGIVYHNYDDAVQVDFTLAVHTLDGIWVLEDSQLLRSDYHKHSAPVGLYSIKCIIPAFFLNRGVYFISLTMLEGGDRNVGEFMRVISFKVNVNENTVVDERQKKINEWTKLINSVTRPRLTWHQSAL